MAVTNVVVLRNYVLTFPTNGRMQQPKAQQRHPKAFSAKYPEACHNLQLYKVAKNDALPSFWQTFAVLAKREGLFHLNQSLQVRASQPDSGGFASGLLMWYPLGAPV